jgi:hypothetical protein
MTVSVSRLMPVEPAIAWDLLVDSSRWADWGPSITDVDVPGVRLRAGTTGRIRSPLGLWVPFTVTDFEEGRSWAWTVAGIRATTHTVEPAPGGCRVTFGIPTVAAPYAVVCRVAARRIDRLARAATVP